jgi:phospholipid transport system substrate-binding protein
MPARPILRFLSTLPLFLVFLVNNAVAASPFGPQQQVKETVDQVVIILRDNTLDWDTKENMVKGIVRERFDFRSMSQSVLATNWKKASPAERERFVEYFSQNLMGTYLEKIQSNSKPYHIRYKGEKVKGKRAVVNTTVVSNGKDIPVIYKLKQEPDSRWYTYDVVIEGQSLVSNYRGVYKAMVKQEGMTGLLDNLESSLKKYRK